MSSLADTVVAFTLAGLMILGGYQIYFLPQRHPFRRPFGLIIRMDDKIPFQPRWVWVYSFLYYPMLLSTIFTLSDFRHFAYTCANFTILLALQLLIAFVFPVRTPPSWREINPRNSLSERFLSVVHHYDRGGNCFPSMHVGAATLSSLHVISNISDELGAVAYLVIAFPLLISLSTLYTKQHYILDIPAGVALAFGVFSIHRALYF